jgi:quercetin dioxygenase-like cupin family protein
MAFKNKIIVNRKTGQQIKFIRTTKDTSGFLLEMEATYPAGSIEPPPHYHPWQVEDFRVLSGELTVTVGDKTRTLHTGDILHIPANEVHTMWNRSGIPAVVNWKVQPALETEYFLETITGLASEANTNAQGKPGLLQVALTARKYNNTFRLSRPPFIIQRILFAILSPLACLFGYSATYKRHID